VRIAPIAPAPESKYSDVPDLKEIMALPQDEMRDIVARWIAATRIAPDARLEPYSWPIPSLAAADFVLVPSRWEGMPYIVLEAMATARPVVSTPVDGACDLVTDVAQPVVSRVIGDATSDNLKLPGTDSTHAQNLLGKLGVHSTLEAASVAHRATSRRIAT